MVQRIKIQSGQIIYEATNSADDINMGVLGSLNVSKELHIGNDALAAGIITTGNSTDVILEPGTNGNIRLQPVGSGRVVLNNAVWPTSTPSQGMYLGATSTNNLQFLSFFLSPQVGSDSLTSSELNVLFPSAEINQQVIGPNVTYQKISSNNWRISSSTYKSVNIAGDTMTGPLILSGSPVNPMQAATKEYVDNIATGLSVYGACETSTIAALPPSTYNNGISGAGSTLTANSNGSLGTIGGYSGLNINSRILVKNQFDARQNGIYVVTQLGSGSSPWILTRASDFDGAPSSEITAGDYVYIQGGTLSGTQWVQITAGTGSYSGLEYVVIGTDDIVFTQLTGPGTYVAGTGISISSNTVTNTGVTSLAAGTGVTLSASTGAVTISGTGGTVTSVGITGGTGISVTGGPITNSGTIALTNTGVTSLTAGTNISVSSPAGAVTVSMDSSPNISGNLIRSVQAGITSTGSDLSTAYVLTKDINVISVVGLGTGVSLPASTGGMQITIVNAGANDLAVYPPTSSAQIDSLGNGVGFILPAGSRTIYFSVSSSQWYTLNATYS